MEVNRNKWQSDFEKQLDIAEKKQISIVKRYYKREYNKGIDSFISEGQTNFQLLFDSKDLLKIYRELYSDIGMRFAKWYANNYQKYLTKNLDPTQLDIWQNSFASFGSAVGAQRVTLVSGTAKNNLIRITQQLMSDPEFMTLGAVERGRILRNQFNTYSQFQSERLVRTEATNAANFATMESSKTIFPGAQMMKEWIASFDDRTRSTHSEAGASDPIPYNEPFMVGGSLMMYPGDPSGDAAEVINCRCSVAPFPKQDAQTVSEITDINFGLGGGSTTGFGLTDVISAVGSAVVSGAQNVVERTGAAFKTIKEFKNGMTDLFSKYKIDLSSIRASRKLTIQQYNLIYNKLDELFLKYNFGSIENQQSIKMLFSSGVRTYGYIERYAVSGRLTKINLGDLIEDAASRTRLIEDKFTTRWFSVVDSDKILLSTPVHEMTHVLLHTSMKGKGEVLDKIREIRRQYYAEIRSLRDANNIKKYNEIYIGKYALHSLDEFIAEAFTEFTLSSNPSKYSNLVGEAIEQYLKN